MSQSTAVAPWWQTNLAGARNALRKDRFTIILFTILLGLMGFYAGNTIMKNTRSTVHLLVAPMPAQGGSDLIEIAPKMDITSITLLCESDEVIRHTMDKIEATGQLTTPIRSLRTLRRALSYEITVANETPMEKTYSDILELTAKSKSPEDAALMVNTWAEELITAVDRYEDGMEQPLLEIFTRHYDDAKVTLTDAEEDREQWFVENNVELIDARRQTVSELVMKDIQGITETETEVYYEQAKVEAFKKSILYLEPKLSLSWLIPEPELANLLGSKLGLSLDIEKPQAKAPDPNAPPATPKDMRALKPKPGEDPPSLEEIIIAGQAVLPPEGTPVLTREMLNTAYWDIYGELLLSEPTVAGLEARLRRIEDLLEEHLSELDLLNAEYMRLEKEKERIERSYGLALEVHDMFYPRKKWLEIAKQVDYHSLQMLSRGTVWPRTYLWGAAGAAAMGMLGLFLAVCTSLLLRVYLQPALKKAS